MSRHTFILERRRSDQMLKPQWLTRNERYSSHRFDFAFCPQFIVWMKFEVAAFAPWLFSSLYEIHRSALYFDFFTSSSLSFFLLRFILTHWQSSLFWWTFAELWSKTCFWLTISLIIHNNMCYCYCFVFIFLSQVFYTLSFQFKRLFRRLCALARLFFSLFRLVVRFLYFVCVARSCAVLCDAVNFLFVCTIPSDFVMLLSGLEINKNVLRVLVRFDFTIEIFHLCACARALVRSLYTIYFS